MAFSFGQPQQAAPSPAQSSPFSFGASTAQKPAAGGNGFSFGAPSQNQQPSMGGGLFGSQNNAQQQQQPQQQQQAGSFGGSLFGSTTQQAGQQSQPQTSSLFGNTNNASGGLFGQQQAQQSKPAFPFSNNAAGPSTNTNTNPMTLSQLGTQPSYQQQQQQNNPLQQSTGFLGGAGANSGAGNLRDSTSQKRLGIPVNDKLEAIRAAWDVRDIQACRFLFYFYNFVPPGRGEESLGNPNFGRRQDAIGPRHDAMWLQTLRENPDRSKLVPVMAVGFPEVKARLEMQQAETQRQSNLMNDLRKRLDDLNTKHTLSNSVRIAAISRKQTSLHHRLISIARKIHLLIPALRGQSVTLKEEQLKSILQNCELELESISVGAADGRGAVNYTTRLRGRINELWALLGNVKAKREVALASEGNTNQLEWAVVDESALDDVAKILASQQQGLDHLSTTLQNDTKALSTVIKGLEGVELTGTK